MLYALCTLCLKNELRGWNDNSKIAFAILGRKIRTSMEIKQTKLCIKTKLEEMHYLKNTSKFENQRRKIPIFKIVSLFILSLLIFLICFFLFTDLLFPLLLPRPKISFSLQKHMSVELIEPKRINYE